MTVDGQRLRRYGLPLMTGDGVLPSVRVGDWDRDEDAGEGDRLRSPDDRALTLAPS